MDSAVRPSKAAPLKKINRISRSDSGVGISIGKSSKTSCESTSSRLFQTELATFCPKKLFYIFIVAESDDASTSILDKLIETSKHFEDVSSLTFITRDDVLSLLDTTNNYSFPNQLKPLLLNVVDGAKEQLSENLEAQLLKLKLIQVMYQQYVDEVKRNEKERNLENTLNILTKECKKRQKKDEHVKDEDGNKSKNLVKDDMKISKKNKKDDKTKDAGKDEEPDYTSIPVDKDGISYEENVFDYIWFYCIKGYYNIDIIQNLIDQVNVPVCAVIKVAKTDGGKSKQSELLESFWERIRLTFFETTTLYKSFEKTVLMQFIPSDIYRIDVGTLEEFVYMLRNIINIKLTYLKYLRHMKINKVQHLYAVRPIECLRQYNKTLRFMPSECVNTAMILDAILQQVHQTLDDVNITDTPSLKSLYFAKSSTIGIHCTDPLHDFNAFSSFEKQLNKTPSSKNFKRNFNTFLVHDNNELEKITKFYKHIGPQIADTTLSLISRLTIFRGLSTSDIKTRDVIHSHDIDPSTELQLNNDKELDHFMYIFLFNRFNNTLESPEQPIYSDHLKNLTTFNISFFWKNNQPKCIDDLDLTTEREVADTGENIYDTSVVHFRWKEKLNKYLLLQEMFVASNQFSYVDRMYSPETDNYLFTFSDKLNEFGINTRIFDVVIRSPICFRDFCRYTIVQENDWLQENRTELNEDTFKIVFDEQCPGAQKVKAQFKIFQEYSHLLDVNIKEELNDEPEHICEKEVTIEDDSIQQNSFDDVLKDLDKLCSSFDITQECDKISEGKQNIAYDLGTNLFKVSGKVTTFMSHDDVKVTVDNAGIFQYTKKCSFNVMSNGSNLTVHSMEPLSDSPYITTLTLKDNSRISFIINKNINETKSYEESTENSVFNPIDDKTEKGNENISVEEKEMEENISNENRASQRSERQLINCVDEDYVKSLLQGKSLEDLPINENHDDLIELLLNATQNNTTVYKINTKTHYLKRRNANLQVSLDSAVRNIISFDKTVDKEPKPYQLYTKRFTSADHDKLDLESKRLVDFRLCLPNGLFIRAYPCVVDTNMLMIKQEFIQEKPDIATVQHEELRLFSNQGLVVIKKIDGTVTILKANGDIINFEKPNDGSGENNTLHSCQCSTLDDYRNKLNKLLRDQENSNYSTSRRGHISSKQNHILDSKMLKVLDDFDVPYFKKSVTKFDGKKIKVQGDKITQKQLYYLTSQQDFFTGEIFFERSDEFRSMFDRSGSQKTVFPDGTIISSSIDICDQLVDDFVYVKLSYQYEHPYYATVKYNFDKTSEIRLNNDVTIEEDPKLIGFKVKVGRELMISVTNENILFQKTCQSCHGQYDAQFNIYPFQAGSWNPKAQFLRVSDSYGKYFYSDYIGNCSRNTSYTKGRINRENCDHVLRSTYKKLFVVERDGTGDLFCTNDFVKVKMKETETLPGASVETYNMISNENITMVDCRQKKFVRYSDRFYNNSVDQLATCFEGANNPEIELYSTYRVFHKLFQSVDSLAGHISSLQQVFFNEFPDVMEHSLVLKNISKLIHALETYYKNHQEEVLDEKELVERKRKQAEEIEKKKLSNMKCCCNKQRMTMKDKMLQWRKLCNNFRQNIKKKVIPSYLKSEFCQMLE